VGENIGSGTFLAIPEIYAKNPSQTLWGCVERKGRFVRENLGSGQTSGSARENGGFLAKSLCFGPSRAEILKFWFLGLQEFKT